jgi:hypothetical protein
MLRGSSTKLTLTADDIKEYETIRAGWEAYRLPDNLSALNQQDADKLQLDEHKKVKKQNVKARIGYKEDS